MEFKTAKRTDIVHRVISESKLRLMVQRKAKEREEEKLSASVAPHAPISIGNQMISSAIWNK